MSISAPLVATVALATFVVIASFSSAPHVAGDWTLKTNEQVKDRLLASVQEDLISRLTPESLRLALPCRLPETPLASDEEIAARHLYAVFSIEDYNRPAPLRAFESMLMRVLLTLKFPIPDWSLGPLQIKPSTALPHLSAAGGPADGTPREAAELLLDSCAHGQIGLSLIATLLRECDISVEPRDICFARAYNGNRPNQEGPRYSEAVGMLVNRSDPVPLINEGSGKTPVIVTAEPPQSVPPWQELASDAMELLAQARALEVGPPNETTSLATWLRQHRRYAHEVSKAVFGIVTICETTFVQTLCPSVEKLSKESADNWRRLLIEVETKSAMVGPSNSFGPASFAIEDLSWLLLQNESLRQQFTPEELDRIGALLTRGAQRFASENPRYILTLSAFECMQKDADLAIGDVLFSPNEVSASDRDSVLECTREFLARLLSSR